VTLQEIAERLLEDGGDRLREAAASLSNRFLSRLEILPIPFRQVAITRLETLLKAYFEEVAKGIGGGGDPVELELKRRVPFPGLAGLRISGQIDRIDERDNVFHVYDYKSGKSPPSKLSRDVSLGYRIQPVLYPWIFLEGKSKSCAPAAFSFIFLGDSPPSERALDPQLNVEEFLKPFAEMLETGMYLPTPSETMRRCEIEGADSCLFCEYASLCRRFDWGACDRYVDLAEQELSSRLLSMRRSSQQKGET
ncbi:MAG: PD-(D/E)XK nuclease family protein, partial [Acidobacteriota bacterium]